MSKGRIGAGRGRRAAAWIIVVACGLVYGDACADQMQLDVITQTPSNPVPIGTQITYQVPINNVDLTPGADRISMGFLIYINGAVVPASATGPITSVGCSPDPTVQNAWACGQLAEGGSTTRTFRLVGQAEGVYDVSFAPFYQNLTTGVGGIPGSGGQIVRAIVGSPPPTITISNATRTEGNTGTSNLQFTVSLSFATTQSVDVNFATADGTATAGSDYVATNGALTIPAGQTIGTLSVPILGDSIPEGTETFTVALSNPTNATLGAPATATGTIQDDDTALSSLSITGGSVVEGNTGSTALLFSVGLSSASTQPVSVSYATAGGTATADVDFTSTAGVLTIPAGQTSATISVPVLGDSIDEPDETFTVTLSAPQNAVLGTTPTATGIITDDDTPAGTLSIANAGAPEGNSGAGNLAFVVSLSSAGSQALTLNYATTDGTAKAGSDYTATSGALTIPAGQLTATILVPVLGDTLVEPNETFIVTLTNPADGTQHAATGTIVNDDGAKIEGGNRTIADGDSEPGVTAEFSATAPGTVDPATLVWTVTAGAVAVDTVQGASSVRLKLSAGENVVRLSVRDPAGALSTLSQVTITVGQPSQIVDAIPGLAAPEREVARGLTMTCSGLQTSDAATLTPGQSDLLATCNKVFAAVGAGDTDSVTQALEQISGRQVTTMQTLATDFSSAQLTNIAARIRALRAGAHGFSLAGLNFQGSGAPVPWGALRAMASDLLGLGGGASADEDTAGDALAGRLGVFANGNIRVGDKDRTARESAFDFHTLGITVGADYRVRDDLFLGAAFGYGKSDTDFDNNGGTLDSSSREASLFGTWYVSNLYLDAIVSYGRTSHDSLRTIDLSRIDIADTIHGDTDGRQWTASLAGGYSLRRGAWTGGPTLSVSYVRVRVDSFAEHADGNSGLALVFPKQDGDSLTVKAGGRLGYAFKLGWGVIVPEIRADMTREFKNDSRPITVQFANDIITGPPGSARTGFIVFTDDPDRYYFDYGASLVAQFAHGIAGFIDYERAAGLQAITSGNFSLGLRIETQF